MKFADRLSDLRAKLEENAIFGGIKDGLFPEDCTCNLCGRELKSYSRSGLCAVCEEKLPLNDGDICLTCGRRCSSETPYCLECQHNSRVFEFARSPFVYEGEAKRLIEKYKFFNARYLSKYFVNYLVDTYLKFPFNAELALAVPLSETAKRKRGYNQSELLAKDFAKRLKLEFSDKALTKIKETKKQVGLSKSERQQNLSGAFAANGDIVNGRNVLLIDDVLTTGATANECSRALLKAGANRVQVLVVASVKEKLYSV